MPANTAAWITAKHAPLTVDTAAYTPPGVGQMVVRTRAVAINSLDWIIQAEGNLTYGWLKYPIVLGADVAGVVVETGEGVTRFTVGDRVIGHAVGSDKDVNVPSEGGFQEYVVLLDRMSSPVPDSMELSDAVVLPLAVSTASCALFQTDHLGLAHPSATPTKKAETVLIWGGSTSVGSNAIQLAVAAGYDVVTTASPKNFDYVRSLGASAVFDYNSPAVVTDLIEEFAPRTLAGAVAFGTTAADSCVRVVSQCSGKRFVSIATPPVSFEGLAGEVGRLARIGVAVRLIASNIALQFRARPRGVALKYIFGTSLKANEVSTAIYRDFLPAALADGSYRPVPAATVVGDSLDDIQPALDQQRRGVSAAKLVVTLG